MNPLMVREASEKLGVCTERIFGLAYEYAETPKSRQFLMERFLNWYHKGIVPDTVEDFVIDVMAERTGNVRLIRNG